VTASLARALPLVFGAVAAGAGCELTIDWQPARVPGEMAAVEVAAGRAHTCILYVNGNLGCWGENRDGQLGFAGTEPVGQPRGVPVMPDPAAVAAGPYHTCAAIIDGTVQCWGTNNDGFLGVATPDCAADRSACRSGPAPVSGITGAARIAAGGGQAASAAGVTGFTCAVEGADVVLCWGDNRAGQLGRGAIGPVDGVPARVVDADGFALRSIVKVATGFTHACAIDADGGVWCWGELPAAGTHASAHRIPDVTGAIDVTAGELHTCVMLADGGARCWGENGNAQAVPFAPSSPVCHQEVDDNCVFDDPRPVAGVPAVTAIAAGARHTCAIAVGGDVVCWGSNQGGQLARSVASLAERPAAVSLPLPAVRLSAGVAHTCAVTNDGAVYCWGGGAGLGE
jgi:alpha-tubulin suppressor-like RCC1 family protein